MSNPPSRREKIIQRTLEILPAFISYNLILFTIWGAFILPVQLAYFVLFFDVFWFYKSFTIAITAVISHLRIQASEKLDWNRELIDFPDHRQVHHVVLVLTANEPVHILERTLTALKNQTFPKDQLIVVLATEAKEPSKARLSKVRTLKRQFGHAFRHFFVTTHQLVPGEIVGKSSNENYAARWVKDELVNRRGYELNYLTISSCDADHLYHPQYFSYLTFKFLDDPHRYLKFWSAPVMFYNNFWRLPAISRVVNTFSSIWSMAQMSRKDRLINWANYTLSLKLLDEVNYWDPDIIPEDYRIFFKAFFAKHGQVEVEPIYLPTTADAAESTSFIKTMKNQYQQLKRWAWGVSDDPYVIKHYFSSPDVSFWNKTIRVLRVASDHILWPVNWFIITLGATVPYLVNPNFSRTSIGFMLSRLSSAILTVCLLFLVIILIVDARQRPPRPAQTSRLKPFLIPFEFILMPIAGFFFNALPGLDAHTRLLLGRYLEYKVTEKV
jgi:glycosyltransferase involved in cell wall biosynthesis